MARYKDTDKDQGQFFAVNFGEQLAQGTYDYTLNDLLIDRKMDLRI